MIIDKLKGDGSLDVNMAVELYLHNHTGPQRGKRDSNPYFSPEVQRIPKNEDRDRAVEIIYHKLEQKRRRGEKT